MLLSMFTMWELSFQQISKSNDERNMIGHFLTLSAFFDFANVGEELFRSFLSREGLIPQWIGLFTSSNAWDQYKYQDIIVELLSLSLLQNVNVGSTESRFSLHPLVADWLKLRTDEQDRQAYVLEALTALTEYINTTDLDMFSFQARQDLLSHMDMCLQSEHEYIELSGSAVASSGDPAFAFAWFYARQGRYKDASILYQRALAVYEKALGLEHI